MIHPHHIRTSCLALATRCIEERTHLIHCELHTWTRLLRRLYHFMCRRSHDECQHFQRDEFLLLLYDLQAHCRPSEPAELLKQPTCVACAKQREGI